MTFNIISFDQLRAGKYLGSQWSTYRGACYIILKQEFMASNFKLDWRWNFAIGFSLVTKKEH
jgi:hypothetical protein